MSEWSSKKKSKFYVHIFPSTDIDWKSIHVDTENRLLYIKQLSKPKISFSTELYKKFWCFKTDGIFWNCCQAKIYSSVMAYIFNKLFVGIDNLVLSCGQNYSGKTFTMSGLKKQYELRGIIPRFVTDLFMHLEAKKSDYVSQVWISAVEIHKNQIYDLLSHPRKHCKEVKEVNQIEISSEKQCLNLLLKAESQRMVNENKQYISNIGAYILKFKVKILSFNSNKSIDILDTVTFVDLAGIGNHTINMKDKDFQDNANITKFFLGLFALRSQKSNTPEKKVTSTGSMDILIKYLGKSLSPVSYKSVICHIRPTSKELNFTLSTLKFGSIFHGTPVQLTKLIEPNDQINKLKEKISELKNELILSDLKESDDIESTAIKLTQGRMGFVKRAVMLFLDDKLTQDDLLELVDDHNLVVNILKCEQRKTHRRVHANTQTVPMDIQNAKDFEQEMYQTEEKSTTVQKSTKHLSIADKEGTSTDRKRSEEIQVNLIEPDIKLPFIDTKERLWTKFLFSRSDIQGIFTTNKAQLDHKMIKQDDTKQYDDNTIFGLSWLQSCRQLDKIRDLHYHQHYQLVSKGETKLTGDYPEEVHEEKKFKETHSEMEWLEEQKKLDQEKIEEEFKQFCITNNYVYIDDIPSSNDNASQTPKDINDNNSKIFYNHIIEDDQVKVIGKSSNCTLQG